MRTYILSILCLIILTASAEKKEESVDVCIKWRWMGDVYDRKVQCIEWAKKDCSQRLHKEICKAGG